jgi:hypothetical protein
MSKIFLLVLAASVALVSAGCADCERYLEQVKGISKTELMRIAMEYESDKDADVLFSLQGCLAVSPDFHSTCERHVTNHGWADFDVLIQTNPEAVCQVHIYACTFIYMLHPLTLFDPFGIYILR